MNKNTKRNCYCNSIDDNFRRREGIPKGYCGICEICQKAGHTQHFPGAVPYTGTWCDDCLKVELKKYRLKRVLFLGVILFFLILLVWKI